MEIEEIVMKLVGPIKPIGDSNTDKKRLDNLKILCDITEKFVHAIDSVACDHKDSYEDSTKTSGKYAENFIKTLVENYTTK
jgi:hypothetical protein